MDGLITGKNDERVGLSVIDNNDAEHVIEMEFDGEIKHHQCEAYADHPKNRTPEENEYNEQARKFAQYYVYLEEGYDTVPPEIHPERLNAVRVALANLDTDEFESLFGDLYQQLRSHYDRNTPRVIDIPAGAADDNSVLYRQDVYLDVDPIETDLAEAQTLAARFGLDLTGEQANDATLTGEISEKWQAFTDNLGVLLTTTEPGLWEELEITAVSAPYTTYVDSGSHKRIGEPDHDPYDREPDALFELSVMEDESLDEFQTYLNHNLICQIRDCFIRMGLEPPEPFQVLGYGRLAAAEQYHRLDMYPDYLDADEETAFI